MIDFFVGYKVLGGVFGILVFYYLYIKFGFVWVDVDVLVVSGVY